MSLETGKCPHCGTDGALFTCSLGALNCAECHQFVEKVDSPKEIIMKDVEYKMYCDCSDPWHFLWFGFSMKNPWTNKEAIGNPELWIRGEFFRGTLWQRIKNAIRYIIKGSYSEQVDLVFFGDSKIEELNKFTKECLDKIKTENNNASI